MGILPLEFPRGQTADTLSLSGEETYDFDGIRSGVESRFACGRDLTVRATRPDGSAVTFQARIRLDTPEEILYYEHGGILPYVLRQLLAEQAR
jgi:aconitate hydratase